MNKVDPIKEILDMKGDISDISSSVANIEGTLETFIKAQGEVSKTSKQEIHILRRKSENQDSKIDNMRLKTEKDKGKQAVINKGVSDSIEGHMNNEKEHYRDPDLDGKWGWAKRHPYLFTFIVVSGSSGAGTIGYFVITEALPRIFGG